MCLWIDKEDVGWDVMDMLRDYVQKKGFIGHHVCNYKLVSDKLVVELETIEVKDP